MTKKRTNKNTPRKHDAPARHAGDTHTRDTHATQAHDAPAHDTRDTGADAPENDTLKPVVELIEPEIIESETKNKEPETIKKPDYHVAKPESKGTKVARKPNGRHDSMVMEADPDKDYDLADIKNPKKVAFLKAIEANGCNITKSAKVAGISNTMHYHWNNCPVYRQVFEKQRARSITALESEAVRRALDGDEEPVYQGGQLVGYKNRKSDNLLMFVMKELKPSYKDSYQPNNGNIFNNSGQVNIQFNIPRPEGE